VFVSLISLKVKLKAQKQTYMMKEEMHALRENDTFELTKVPENRSVVGPNGKKNIKHVS
jgi:hypothetical protein